MNGFRNHVSVVALLVAAVSVSGCLRGGGGGGGGAADLDGIFAEVQALGLTQNMPTELVATYEGGVKLGVSGAAQTGRVPSGTISYDDADAIVTGDLSINITWNESMSPNADISGTADNFQMTRMDNGSEITRGLDGSLSVTEGSGGIIRTTFQAPDIMIPDGVATGSISFGMTGTLTDTETDESVSPSLLFGGQFYGDGAEAAYGTASGLIYEDPELSIPDGTAIGEFFLKKKP